MKRLAWLLAGWVLLAPAQAESCARPLRVGFYDSAYPPALLGNGLGFADPPGWAVLAARDAARRLGCTLELLRRPPRRLEAELERGELDFILFYGATPERLRRHRFPLDAAGQPDAAWAPMFGHLAFYALSGSAGARGWNGRLAAGLQVGALSGSAQETLARERGWPTASSAGFEASVQALRAGRFDLLLSARETLTPEQLGGSPPLIELAPLVQTRAYFMPASAALWAAEPRLVNRVWREYCQSVRRIEPQARGLDCGLTPAR